MRSLLPIVTAALLMQIACGENPAGKPNAASAPVAAGTMALRNESIQTAVEAPGTVQPRNRISLAAQVNGFVREMRVRAGDVVKQDQLLALLDARDAQNQKAAAQAAVDEAQGALSEARQSYQAAVQMQTAAKASADLAWQTFARYQKLAEARSVSPQELDEVRMRRDAGAAELASREAMVAATQDRIRQVEARIAQARAGAGRADVMLGWTEIKAPSRGRIVQRMADPGTAIFPGSPLLVVESTERPQVLADIPAEHSDLLHIGLAVKLRDPEAGTVAEGRITEITPLSDPATHSMKFKVDLPPGVSMPTGRFITVLVPSGTREALLAPVAAVRQSGQLTGMFAVDGASKAHFRLVKVAPYDSGRVEVLSGIDPGEKVIAKLSARIVDGITVAER